MEDIILPLEITNKFWVHEGKTDYIDYPGKDERIIEGEERVRKWKEKFEYLTCDESVSIEEANAWISENNFMSSSDEGKWMLYYDKSIFNSKWVVLVNLYRQDKLIGITSMKCSTSRDNPRGTSDDGVIILYCNYSFDEKYIRNIGLNILELTDYNKIIYYKTNNQTRKGTRSTGQIKNSIYKIDPIQTQPDCPKLSAWLTLTLPTSRAPTT